MRKTYETREDYDEDQRHQLPPRLLNGNRIPAMMVTGTHPFGMRYHYTRPWVSVFEAMNGLTNPLNPGATIAIIGTGFGWEVEIATRLGYQAVGVETSPYVETMKATSYEADYRAQISSEGLDPDNDAGADLLAEWMTDGRTTATILNEDISTRDGLKNVKTALGVASGQKIDWAISANVLPVLDDAEAEAMNTSMLNLADHAAHYTPIGKMPDGSGKFTELIPGEFFADGTQKNKVGNRTNYSWKSLMAWKALLTPATIMRTVAPIKVVVDGKPTWPRLTVEVA